jgi:hypothetical protein
MQEFADETRIQASSGFNSRNREARAARIPKRQALVMIVTHASHLSVDASRRVLAAPLFGS